MSEQKPKLSPEASRRRALTTLPLTALNSAVHQSAVALDLVQTICRACDLAIERRHAIDPAGLKEWITSHYPQLDPATAIAVSEPETSPTFPEI
jgi:hypothetical protein